MTVDGIDRFIESAKDTFKVENFSIASIGEATILMFEYHCKQIRDIRISLSEPLSKTSWAINGVKPSL